MTESGWTEASTDTIQNDESEWAEVDSEEKIVLEHIGDGFTGRLMGIDPPNNEGIVQSHWTNVTSLTGEEYPDSFLNLTRDLINKLKKVPVKAMVRIQWTDNLNTGHESGTPMRIYKVQWKR